MNKVKIMIDTEWEQQQLQIEAILEEAQIYGLRWEVQQTALKMLEDRNNSNKTLTEIYEYAFLEWIK